MTTVTKTWRLEIQLFEEDDVTKARTVLDTGEGAPILEGTGRARRRPGDQPMPQVGDELAAARALLDVAHELLEAAARQIEGVEHRPVHLEA